MREMKLNQLYEINTMDELISLKDSLNLTERQEEIFMKRFNKGHSIIELSMELNLSTSTINRELSKIAKKIKKIVLNDQKRTS